MKTSSPFTKLLGIASATVLAISVQAGPTYLNVDTSAASLIGSVVVTDTGTYYTGGGALVTGTFDVPTTAGYFIASDAPGAPGPNTPVDSVYKNFGNAMMVYCLDLDWYVDGGIKGSLPNYWEAKQFPAANQTPPHTGNPAWVQNGIYRAAYIYNQYLPVVIANAGGSDDLKAQLGAGLQFAIWEVLYEERNTSAYSLTGAGAGDFYVTYDANSNVPRVDAAIAQANAWLAAAQAALNGITEASHPFDMVYWDPMDYNAQDPTGNPWMHDFGRQALIGQAVPEPAEIALIAAALAGLFVGYRRIAKSTV